MTISPNASSALQKAEKFLKDQGISSLPIDPQEIAERLGIVVEPKRNSASGVSSMLVRHGNNFGILYATHIASEGFQRFSVAHELGHYLLEGHPEHIFRGGGDTHASRAGFVSKDPFEQEADYFATGLLMPDPMFTTALGRGGDGLAAIQKLADLCRTSLTATSIRYAQKADLPVAVVMSSGNRIDYCFMSKSMEDFSEITWLRKREFLPGEVATAHFNSDPRNVAEAKRQEVDTDLQKWFGGSRHIAMTEEIVGLGSYGRTLTVLSTNTFADEEEEEDEELEEQWTPRFHR
jgi:Zn-dependent peptidase ImmA (M78 family)